MAHVKPEGEWIFAAKKPAKQAPAAKAPRVGDTLELIGGTLEIEAEAPAEGDNAAKSKPRRFTMNAYNGGAMRLMFYCNPVVIDLEGMEGTDRSRPAFLNHDPGQIVGHTDKIMVKKNSVTASGLISGAGDAAKEVCAAADNGFPWQCSVGARVLNMEYVDEDSTAKCNGQEFNGPINIARKSVLGEISFVPLGADDSTSARVAATAAKGSPMNFEQWLEAKGFKLADLSDAQKTSLQAMFTAETTAAANTESTDESVDESVDETADESVDDKAAAKASARRSAHAGAIMDLTKEHDKIVAAARKDLRKELLAERKKLREVEGVLSKYKDRVDAKKFAEIEASAIGEEADGGGRGSRR
jgi:hypothetical protein